jgi:hypothetical protein
MLNKPLLAFAIAVFCLGCEPQGTKATDTQASPKALMSGLSAAAKAGDWGTYYDLLEPKLREKVAYQRVGSVVVDALTARAPRKEKARSLTDELGIDLDSLPKLTADRAVRRKALLAQLPDLRVPYIKSMKLWEARSDPRFTPRKLLDPGRVVSVSNQGADRAEVKTSHAGGSDKKESSWTLTLVRLNNKWLVEKCTYIN